MSQLYEVMRARIEKILEGKRKEILLNAITPDITPKQAISVNCLLGTGLIGKSSAEGFDRITEEKPLEFPKDHFLHENYALEWYFGGTTFKGVKIDSQGNHLEEPAKFTSLVCFFYRRIEPGNQKMILETHFLIVKENDTYEQSDSEAIWNYDNSLVIPDSGTNKFVMKSNSHQISSLQNDDNYFESLHFQGKDEIKGLALDFKVEKTGPIFLQEGRGYMGDIENGIAYGYYTTPQMKTTGTLKYKHEDYLVLEGKMWLDHEWGTIGRPLTKKTQKRCNFFHKLGVKFRPLDRGYGLFGFENWFGFQFDDDSVMTAVHARISRLPKNKFLDANAYYMDSNGKQITLSETKLRIVEVVELEDKNDSPIDGRKSEYPTKFEFINTPKGDFFLTALVPDQRMKWAGGGYAYEGGAIITDTSGKEIGMGFIEGVGWDNKFAETVLNKLGIDKSHVKLFDSRSKIRGLKSK